MAPLPPPQPFPHPQLKIMKIKAVIYVIVSRSLSQLDLE